MFYRALADIVLVLHLAFIVFAVAGGLLVLRWRGVCLLHLPALVWGVYVELLNRVCPLTFLENKLRHAAGEAGYTGGFIEHYLLPVVYPQALTRSLQFGLAALLVLVNLIVYSVVVPSAYRRLSGRAEALEALRRRRRSEPSG